MERINGWNEFISNLGLKEKSYYHEVPAKLYFHDEHFVEIVIGNVNIVVDFIGDKANVEVLKNE